MAQNESDSETKNLARKRKVAFYVGVISLAVLRAALTYAGYYAFTKRSVEPSLSTSKADDGDEAQITGSVTESVVEAKCNNNWTSFKSDLLGVKFCYPSEWGEAQTEPVKYLTKLEGAVDKYSESEENSYRNRIVISFSKTKGDAITEIEIFNDKYKGEHYPNERALELGYVDNLPVVEKSGSICDYRIDFTWPETGDHYKEISNQCEKAVQAKLLEQKQVFDSATGTKYTYTVKGRSFKKLQNGYFDNLVITSQLGLLSQIDTQIDSLGGLYRGMTANQSKAINPLDETEYSKSLQDLQSVYSTIVTYAPVSRKQLSFKIIKGEDPNAQLIRKFYWYLDGKNLAEAYKLYADQTIGLAKFSEQYQNLYRVEARDVVLKNGSYDLYLDNQNHNTKPTVYHIVASVTNGLISTTSSEEITTPIVTFGNYKAYAKKVNGRAYMILREGESENVLTEAEAENDKQTSNIGTVAFYRDPAFSQSGNYLTFKSDGWEWSSTLVYDVKSRKQLIDVGTSTDTGFVNDERNFFACAGPGMGGGYGKIYTLPSGNELYDAYADKANESKDIKCEYVDSAKTMNIKLYDGGTIDKNLTKTIVFDLLTGKVK